ncbi:hypothetical protein GOBAR_AA26060 [Gossypium barbadense]|uniref:Uncharacterized protein n=1 Tax=Gossypium barbadense TaxID=3634 RepID=A0A2P5WU69_GOSBA|nr:hypothetical protein GOBAR_AA26060 [Gossypium barbadense]
MATLYCLNKSGHIELFQLFVELDERVEDFTLLSEEYGAQDPCTEIDADVRDGYDNNGPSDHEVEYYSDLNLDEILDDIDDKGIDDDENVHVSSVENPSQDIAICNDLRPICRS